ncbi:hypothetical protein AMK59_2015 [Oryctes borbonicus]|uniref:Uncharacterized protein n=1 Tax=Oryctes borbonicus TaxID=1629725 RepID=A0A0T6BES1_9SCAR|nr:hypothetical protein AMK59_2015 [Oryctes borbonicus]
MQVLKFSNNQFAELSKILNRPRPNIEKRYKLLQEIGRTLKPNDYSECVKYLMKITGFDNLQSAECEHERNANEAINTDQHNYEIEFAMSNGVKCEAEENRIEINTEVDETISNQTSVMEAIGRKTDKFKKIESSGENSEDLNPYNKGKNTDSSNNNERKRKRMHRSVYKGLRVPSSYPNKRRCTSQEDAVIVECMNALKSTSRPLAELSKILYRSGFSVGKRHKDIRRKSRQPLKSNNYTECYENEDRPKFKKRSVTQIKKCITAPDWVSNCEMNDSQNKESTRKMLEIISNANSTLFNIFEKNEKLRQLTVNITWNVPLSHMIETRISSCPTKKQQQQFFNLGIKFITGPFTIKEDETIKENFKCFCAEHWLEHNPTPFLCLRYGQASILNKEERVKFGRYLGRGLENRKLHCIYSRFKVLYSTLKKGRN